MHSSLLSCDRSEGFLTVKCECPRYILHPYAKSYFIKHGTFCYKGFIYNDYTLVSRTLRSRFYNDFYKKYISSFFKMFNGSGSLYHDFDTLLLDYHFVGDDGELLPMFMIVPCGKCQTCRYSKLNDIANRCELETLTSKCNPLFVTLTYNNNNLPEDGSVSLDDIQKFVKLLRINLNRFFATPYEDDKGVIRYNDAHISLRYIYCSEYSPNNHRPHYHLLIWNVPYFPNGLSDYQERFLSSRLDGYPTPHNIQNVFNSIDSVSRSCVLRSSFTCDLARVQGYDILKKLIWCSWKKGFIKCDVSQNAGRYVAKYIGKGSDVPSGCKPTFVKWSTRRGLGYDAFDLYFRDILLKNPTLTSISFTDAKSGQLRTIGIPKYYRNLLAPSLSIVSKPFRQDLTEFHKMFNFGMKLYRSMYGTNWNEWQNLHACVYKKFQLFDSLCGLSDPLLLEGYPDVYSVINETRTCLDEYDLFKYLDDSFKEYYDILMSFDLDSIHLQDILNYKYVSQMALIDFAKHSKIPIDKYREDAQQYFDRVKRLEYSNSTL